SSSPQEVVVCEVSRDSLDESCSKLLSPVGVDEVDNVELMWCASPISCRRAASPTAFGPTHMLDDLSPVTKPLAPDLSPIRLESPNLSPIQNSEKIKSLKHNSPLTFVQTSPITVHVNRDTSEMHECTSPGLSPVNHIEYKSSRDSSSLLMKTNSTTPPEVCGVYPLLKSSTSSSSNKCQQKSSACRVVLKDDACHSPLGCSMYSGSNSSSIMHTTSTSLSSSNSNSSCSIVASNPMVSSSNSSVPCSSAASSMYHTPREWHSTAWSLEEVKETSDVETPDVRPPQAVTPQSNPHSTGSGHFSSSPIRNISRLSHSNSRSPPTQSPGGKFALSPPVSPILCRSLIGQSTVQPNRNHTAGNSRESQHMSINAGESMCSIDDMEDVEEGNMAPGGTTSGGRWWLEEHCSRASFQTLRRTNSTIDMDTDSQPFLEGSNTEGTFQDTGYQTGSLHCTNYSLAHNENNSAASTSNNTQSTKSKVFTCATSSHTTNTGNQVTPNTVILSEFAFPHSWPAQ
ncbi:unnamed protein product, partial [Meganyctiphanes norvegica]